MAATRASSERVLRRQAGRSEAAARTTISDTRSAQRGKFARSASVTMAASSAANVTSGCATSRAIESASSAWPRDTSRGRLCASADATPARTWLRSSAVGAVGTASSASNSSAETGCCASSPACMPSRAVSSADRAESSVVAGLAAVATASLNASIAPAVSPAIAPRASEIEQQIGTSAQVQPGHVTERHARSEELGCRRAITTFEREPRSAVQCRGRLCWALLPRLELTLQPSERRPDVRADLRSASSREPGGSQREPLPSRPPPARASTSSSHRRSRNGSAATRPCSSAISA